MQVSLDRWGRTDAWKEKEKEDPEEFARVVALAVVEHHERAGRQ